MYFFRIDIGSTEGLGHYARILSLVKFLKIKKYKIIVNKLPPNYLQYKEKKNFIEISKIKEVKNEIEDAKIFVNILKNMDQILM